MEETREGSKVAISLAATGPADIAATREGVEQSSPWLGQGIGVNGMVAAKAAATNASPRYDWAGTSAWLTQAMHTYTAIYVHVVFATWSRCPFLDCETRPDLHAYLSGISRNLDVADVYVGGVEDHVHFVGRFGPTRAISDVIGQIKKSSGDWLRERIPQFRWQRGYGAFSVSPDRVRSVQRYVMRQEEHHHRRTFHQELEELCAELGISIDDLGIL